MSSHGEALRLAAALLALAAWSALILVAADALWVPACDTDAQCEALTGISVEDSQR